MGLIGVALIVAADKITKFLAVEHIAPRTPPGISIIDGVFSLFYSTNDGAAFGILSGQSLLLSAVSAVITVGLVYFYIRLPKYVGAGKVRTAIRVAMTMVAGGAVGNLIDRVRPPHEVVDFLYFELINFPIFNVADIFIVCGSILLCALLVFFVKDEKPKNELEEMKEETVKNVE